ncbi:MAG: hypothetical protein QNJ89_00450 [Acidimicrobiia bacterium]|nr:hypothetical protein [Acidimicrobiia bacterium]
MRKRLLVLLATLTVLMTVAVAAQAQEDDASIEGKGYIWAKGSGVAILDGRGRVQMAIDGDVVIYDYAGDAVVKIGAVPEEEPDGAAARLQEVSPTTTYTFDNFRGRMQVVGSDFRIEAEGDMKFRGRGEGTVELDGRGWWKTLRNRGTWEGTVLRFGRADVLES